MNPHARGVAQRVVKHRLWRIAFAVGYVVLIAIPLAAISFRQTPAVQEVPNAAVVASGGNATLFNIIFAEKEDAPV